MSRPPAIPPPRPQPGIPARGPTPAQEPRADAPVPRSPPPGAASGDQLEAAQPSAKTGGLRPSSTQLERTATQLARVSGQITTPAVISTPADLMGHIHRATLGVQLPLREGARLHRLIKVRPDTQAVVRLAVTDGRIDRERTRITFETSDGQPTDLDGPLWWNPEAIYIAEDGTIRAEVPCFPDPNITRQVLGEDVDRVPDDLQAFLRVMQERSQDPQGLQFIDPQQLATNDRTLTPYDGPTGRRMEMPDLDPELLALLDFSGLGVTVEGELRPGPLRLGDGAVVNIAPGTVARLQGNPTNLQASIEGRARSVQFEATGTRFLTGQANIALELSAAIQTDERGLPAAANGPMAVSLRSMTAENIVFETPAGEAGQERLHTLRVSRLSVAESGALPLLAYQAGTPDVEASLSLSLPGVSLEGISAELQADGSDGSPAVLRLGGDDDSFDIRADLFYDSRADEFRFLSQVDNLHGELAQLALAEGDGFGIVLGQSTLSGSGSVELVQRGNHRRLQLSANPENPLTVAAQVQDAQMGTGGANGFFVDLSHETRGRMSLHSLDLQSGSHPVFAADAEFDVTLDRIHIPLGEDRQIQLREGTRGTLTLGELAWEPGNASPQVQARLTLDVSAQATLQADFVPSLEGGRLYIESETGRTLLELDATLDGDGNLRAAAGFTLQALDVRTRLSRGGLEIHEDVQLSDRPLTRRRRAPMEQTRDLAPVPPGAQSRPREPRPPTDLPTPQLTLLPAQMAGAIDSANLNVTVNAGEMHLSERWSREGMVDGSVALHVHREAGPIRLQLQAEGGALQPGDCRMLLDPPFEFQAVAEAGVAGLGAAVTTSGQITGLRLEPDGEGAGRWVPEVRFNGRVPAALRAVGLEDKINGFVGSNLIGLGIFGRRSVPLSAQEMFALIEQRMPQIGEAVSVTDLGTDSTDNSIPLEGFSIAEARTTLRPGLLDLGNGQSITFREGTKVTISGSHDDFTVEGGANLGALNLGGPEAGIELAEGSANLRIRIRQIPGQPTPAVEIDVSDLHGSGLTLSGKYGQAHGQLSGGRVRDGSFQLRQHPQRPVELTANLPNVAATLGVRAAQEGLGAIDARMEGSVSVHNGSLAADIDDLHMLVRDLGIDDPDVGAAQGTVLVQGRGRLELRDSGDLHLQRHRGGGSLNLTATATLADGSHVELTDGAVRNLTVQLGPPAAVRMEDFRASISAVLPVPGSAGVLDVRSASLQGGIELSHAGLRSLGAIQLSNLDASLTNVALPEGAPATMQLLQMDLRGDATLERSADGSLILDTPNTRRAGRRVGLEGRAVARQIAFNIDDPNHGMDMEIGRDAYMEVDLRRLHVSPQGHPSIHLNRAHFDGSIQRGRMQIGHRGTLLESVDLQRGTRVVVDVHDFATGRFAGGRDASHVRVDATARVEGAFRQRLDNIGNQQLQEHLRLDDLQTDGRFRTVVRARVDGPNRLAVNAHLALDASGRAELSGQVAPAVQQAEQALEQAAQEYLESRRDD